ncbi:MAG TPA: TetR/AcrR family transcriptional regulator, partial [Beijerinckiaceae bacterium]
LKDALVEAARALIERSGPGGFSLSEAARIVGVTPAAPYRHFTDREALTGEVAKRGFEIFCGRLAGAWDGGRPEPMEAFRRMGRAYLDFARREPGYYRSMFTNAPGAAAGPSAASENAFRILTDAAAALLRANGRSDAGAHRLALEIWSLSHGVAMLMLSGLLRQDPDPDALLDRAAVNLVRAAVAERP